MQVLEDLPGYETTPSMTKTRASEGIEPNRNESCTLGELTEIIYSSIFISFSGELNGFNRHEASRQVGSTTVETEKKGRKLDGIH